MNTLEFIANKYKINVNQRRQPVEIPNTTRETFAELLGQLGMNRGVEVGVERGIYSEILLKANPLLFLYSIDAWTAYDTYRDHMTQEEMDLLYEQAQTKLYPYRERNVVVKGFSVNAAETFPDESLDFVYLDGNHEFAEVVKDIAAWERKVKVGGIVAGHDYIKRRTNNFLMHVPYAVDSYVAAYQIKPLFILGRKLAKANLNPKRELRDSTRSWFYVKPPRDPMRPGYKQTP